MENPSLFDRKRTAGFLSIWIGKNCRYKPVKMEWQEDLIGDLLQEKNIKPVGADALSPNGFTQVPNYMLKSPHISSGAKLTCSMLLGYAWGNDYCFPGQEITAKKLAKSQ